VREVVGRETRDGRRETLHVRGDVRKDEFLRAAFNALGGLAPHEKLRVAVGAPRLAELALDDLAHEQVAEQHDVQVRRLRGHDEREWPMHAVLHRE
jgi:hypothetical protein